MKRTLSTLFVLPVMLMLMTVSVAAQESKKSTSEEVYTGTIKSMNGSMGSTSFTLRIKAYTTDEEAQRYLGLLVEGDQDDLLKVIRDFDMGRLSTTNSVGRHLIVVRKTKTAEGETRIVVAFERWQTIAEQRGGYRTQDYPFGLMEIIVNAKGEGSGTFIAACKVDLKKDKKTGKYQLELENFGTFPHKVMGVMLRK